MPLSRYLFLTVLSDKLSKDNYALIGHLNPHPPILLIQFLISFPSSSPPPSAPPTPPSPRCHHSLQPPSPSPVPYSSSPAPSLPSPTSISISSALLLLGFSGPAPSRLKFHLLLLSSALPPLAHLNFHLQCPPPPRLRCPPASNSISNLHPYSPFSPPKSSALPPPIPSPASISASLFSSAKTHFNL